MAKKKNKTTNMTDSLLSPLLAKPADESSPLLKTEDKSVSDTTSKTVEGSETESTWTAESSNKMPSTDSSNKVPQADASAGKEKNETPDDLSDAQAGDAAEVSDDDEDDDSNSGEDSEKDKDGKKKGKGGKKKDKDKKKEKLKGIPITAASAFELEREVSKNMAKHNLANQYFAFRHFWYFTVPQAILTCVSSILAFIGTSEFLTSKQKVIINTIVGSTSGVVVFLQTMGGICNYGSRADMHQSAAIDLRDLRDDLHLLKQKLKQIEINNKQRKILAKAHGEEHEDSHEKHGETFETISSRFRQSLSACKSNVPMGLTEAFSGIDSNLLLARSRENDDYMKSIYGEIEFDSFIQSKAYDILAGEILNSYHFPLVLPNSKDMVRKTMDRLRGHINVYQNFWHRDSEV